MSAKQRPPVIRVDRPVPSELALFQDPWVPFPEGMAVMKEMKSLMERPDEGRPKNLALLADPSFGKSHLLDHFADCFPDIIEPAPRIQVLSIELPPEADSAKLLREMLHKLSVSFSFRTPPDELLRKVIIHLHSLSVALIIFDEFHNALSGRRDRALGIVQTLRAISNRGQRPIVVAGTKKVEEVLRYDEQLNERFLKWHLPRWDDVAYVKKLLSTFEYSFDAQSTGKLGTDEIAKKVISLSGGRPGAIANLLRDSRKEALRTNGGEINDTVLDECAKKLVGQTIA
jgi:hypothetical protein